MKSAQKNCELEIFFLGVEEKAENVDFYHTFYLLLSKLEIQGRKEV